MSSPSRIIRVLVLAAPLALLAGVGAVSAQGEDDEAFWRGRARATHRAAADARARYDEVMAEYSRLRTKHRDRGERKTDLLEKKQQAEESLREAERRLEELPEEARRAGAPPGWVRVFPEDL